MVLPFLAIYMTTQLGYSVQQAGWIMSVYGVGSLIGSYGGGWLTDKIGAFKVQFYSLLFGGILFLFLPLITGFYALVASICITSIAVEMLRPANTTSVSLYVKPENITRAFSLNRMAVNLGISIGPAIGGVLAGISYTWLFIGDGITCIVAAYVFYWFFKDRQVREPQHKSAVDKQVPKQSPIRDLHFMFFVVCCGMFGMLFLQIFQILPLFYRQGAGLSESEIGLILGFNGLIVFGIEMILVYSIENRFPIHRLIISGTLLCGLSFIVLLLGINIWVLYLGMFLLSISEILAMPFMVTQVVNRAGPQSRGSYLGMYTMSWSLAFIISPFITTYLVGNYGFDALWYFDAAVSIVAATGFLLISEKMKQKPNAPVPAPEFS